MNIKDFTSNLNVKRILAIAIGLFVGQYVGKAYAWFKNVVGVEIAGTVLGILFLAGLIVGINAWWKQWLSQPNVTPSTDPTAQ